MPYSIRQVSNRPRAKVTSTMPVKGETEVFPPQGLTPAQALLIDNYFIRRQMELERRNGSRKRGEVASSSASKILRQWTDTILIIGYGTTLAAFNLNNNTFHTIKSNFSANLTDGKRYGLDFYSCNGKYGDKIYKTTLPDLDFDAQSANFTVGQVVTGGTSGATATIISQTDAGATGSLVLDNITGTFADNELITDPLGGSATVNGTLTWTNTAEISASAGTVPKCEALHIFDKSLCALNTNNNESESLLSKQNDFTNWDTTVVTVGSAISVTYAFAGPITSAANFQTTSTGNQTYGNILVIFYKDGWAGFQRSSVDLAGTITQTFPTVFEKINAGGERGALSTPFGILFCNENGLQLLPQGTQTGESINLMRDFKTSRLDTFDFTDNDVIWLQEKNRILVTLREAAASNNKIFWFDSRTVTSKEIVWGELSGLSIARFELLGRTLYGASSNKPKVIELFPDGVYDDEGSDVYYHYKQPLNFGALETLKDVKRLDIGGYLSSTSEIRVQLVGVDEESGDQLETGVDYTFSGNGSGEELSAFSEAEFSVDAFSDLAVSDDDLQWQESSGYQKPNNLYKSYIVDISGNDKVPHRLSYVSIEGEESRKQRKNVLNNNS